MRIVVFSLFPELITNYCKVGLLGKALESSYIELETVGLREFGEGKNLRVDDTPYGGGAGMLLKVEPIVRAIRSQQKPVRPLVLLTPGGERLTQKKLVAWSSLPCLGMIAGRYEGFDARVSHFVDEEVSLGSYILMGGELAALAIIEGLSRIVPGVLGNPQSFIDESFSEEAVVEYPQFTKPREFEGMVVPEVLLNGNHEQIRKWRKQQQKS